MVANNVDFYEELHLDSGLSTEELKTELSRLETVWKRREITNPEKAAKMSALIIDARKVFQSDEARRKYDASLNSNQNDGLLEEPKHEVQQWQIDALNKAEAERQQLEKQENQKLRERTQRIENRKATTAALYKKAWLVFVACAAVSILSFAFLGLAHTPVFLLAIIMFGGMAFLNFADMYRNGSGSGGVMMVSILGGFIFCFMSATARYTQMGYSAASASATWKTIGILLVILIAVIVIMRNVGKSKANSEMRQNLY